MKYYDDVQKAIATAVNENVPVERPSLAMLAHTLIRLEKQLAMLTESMYSVQEKLNEILGDR